MDRDTLWQLFQCTGLPEAYTFMAQVGQEERKKENRGEHTTTDKETGQAFH